MSASERYGLSRWRPKQRLLCAALCLLLSLILGGFALGQETTRKVTSRTAPAYPELARRMHLSGKVKIELVITPAGAVKSAKFAGGNPVFEQSALDAVKQWKFEAAEKETTGVILLEFAEPQ